ncbi:MAG: tetratricopeptide repeat protein [Planctomycetota bacterium]
MKRPIFITLALVLAAGCADGVKPQQAASEAANQRWNAARSGVLLSLAEDQFESGDLAKSRLTADEALTLNPGDARLLTLRARIAIEEGKLENADADLTAALELSPDNAESHYLAGIVDQRWQRPDAALGHYEAASRLEADEPAYLLAHAEALVSVGRDDEALHILQDRVVHFEHSAPVRSAVAELHMRRGDFALAAEMYRHASVLDRDDLQLRERLALATFQAGQMREAELELSRLLKDPAFAERADLWLAYGEALLAVGQFRDGRDAFLTVTRLAPRGVPGWAGLTKASLELGDGRRAVGAARQVETLEPDNPESHLLLGLSAQLNGDHEQALAAYRFAARLDPSDPLPACLEGRLLQIRGDIAAAAESFARALDIDPDDPLARQLASTLGS